MEQEDEKNLRQALQMYFSRETALEILGTDPATLDSTYKHLKQNIGGVELYHIGTLAHALIDDQKASTLDNFSALAQALAIKFPDRKKKCELIR
jgi:hypothetical protein